MYLAPRPTAENPEAQGFSTTLNPITTLNVEEIQAYLASHPEVAGYKVIIIGPPVRGKEAGRFKALAEQTLQEAGITDSPVQIIRHPATLTEKLLNILPRKEDYEAPLKSELTVAAFKIGIAESLSFTVLLAPPILQANGVELGSYIDSIVDKIALPMGTAVAMCVMDVANMIPLISFRRALSNHNIRLTPFGRFMRQFILSMYFSFGFYTLSQNGAIIETISTTPLLELPGQAMTAGWEMLKVIIPASIFNMGARTTVGTSLNIWEHGAEGRRFWTSVMEAVTGILIAPVYILSTMPVLSPVIETPIMDLNAAHLTMLGIGTAGGVAWGKMASPTFNKVLGTCATLLKNLGAMMLKKPKGLSGQQSDGDDEPREG